MTPSPPTPELRRLVLGPWVFVFVPDGDDPGVGTLTVWSAWGGDHLLAATPVDAVPRQEWDDFVRGATL